jgi:hypothetical protein
MPAGTSAASGRTILRKLGRIERGETRENPNRPDKLPLKSSNSLQNSTQFDVNVENEEL